MTAPPVIHVIDDDASFRVAVSRLLAAAGYQVTAYESADGFLRQASRVDDGCILLDVRMPGLTGPDLQDRLNDMDCVLPIIFLTGHGDIAMSVKAVKAGAEDFLSKPVSKQTLLGAVERALARCREQREQRDQTERLRALIAELTPREHQVFMLAVRGKMNKQIAYELGTSERTVKAHRRAVMEKLKVGSLAEGVSIAERLGMLKGPVEKA
jgi:RNA polymerase sigma factor (sigma-70 family)